MEMRKNICLAITALLVCLSCCTSTDGDGNGNDYDQTTVLGTLNLFLDVWNDGDLDAYENLLDDDFTFYFDPRDVQDHGLPESWDYEAEITAYTNLFDAIGPENVDVQLDLSGITEPEEGAETYLVEDVPYEVYVYIEAESFDIEARGDLDMQLEKTDGQWVVTDWWDKVSSLLLVEDTSWGAIKAEF